MPLDACTIVSKNYLPFARVLARSFHEQNPEGRFFVLLYDRNDEHIDVSREPFELLEVEQLDIPELRGFLFKYTVLEGNTAAKPYFLEYLFEQHNCERLLYLDPDIWVMNSLADLDQLLQEHLVVLTPHLDQPIDDAAHPGEQSILQSGTYNLGFVGLRRDPETLRLLHWWQARLWDQCVVAIDEGLFVDQKWMDLSPGLFDGVHVLRDPGYNVAYWNLHGRTVTIEDGAVLANQRPLVFFHFSGIEPHALKRVSKHQDRFTLDRIGQAADLYRSYSERLMDEGFDDCRAWPFAFATFDNGVRVPAAARRLYLSLNAADRAKFGDPFAAGDPASFFHWLNQAHDGRGQSPPTLSRLLAHLWAERSDLHADFPDPAGASWPNFSSWLRDCGRSELGLDEPLLANLHRESPVSWFTPSGFRRRSRNSLRKAWRSDAAIDSRRWLKGRMGAERFNALKGRLRPKRLTAHAAAHQPNAAVGSTKVHRPGINLIGYLSAETGMGEAARGLARALATTDIPHSLHNLELGVVARKGDPFAGASTLAKGEDDFQYDINLLVANADQVPHIVDYLGPLAFTSKVNVGYWLWELENFPREFSTSFDQLQEVWTSSTYCVDAISTAAPVPVRRVALPIERPSGFDGSSGAHREHFKIDPDTFVVLYMFNFLSHFERKNPLALVRAFEKAFDADDDVLLVLKTSQASFAEAEYESLLKAAEGSRIRVVNDYLDRAEVWRLLAAADAYASPHCAEGYGLTLVESMALGKPVIAAPYSGVADFFNLNTGLEVRYRRVALSDDHGPYASGSRWAQIDEQHLAERLKEAFENQQRVAELGEAAQRVVEEELSYAAIGRRLQQRYDAIVERFSP